MLPVPVAALEAHCDQHAAQQHVGAHPDPGAVQPAAPQSSGSVGGGGSSGGAGTYTVRAGDSLSAIASRHGVKLNALLTANGLQLTSLIMPGMQLTLPSVGRAVSRSVIIRFAPATGAPSFEVSVRDD